MENELAITGPNGFDAATGDAPTAETSASRPRLRLRSRWSALDEEARSNIMAVVFAVSLVVSLVGSAYGALAIWKHNGSVQAIERAKMMDGGTYLVTPTGWTFFGDTILRVEDENGVELGWVAMHNTNPLTLAVNPMFLAFSDKRYDPIPSRVPVRARYKKQAWTNADGHTPAAHGNFTGDYLEFEPLARK